MHTLSPYEWSVIPGAPEKCTAVSLTGLPTGFSSWLDTTFKPFDPTPCRAARLV